MRELEFIEWIRSRSNLDPAAVPVGPGDDCAVVRSGGERLLVTVDQALDGVHFILAEHGAEAAGRKAMARNLSDVAAMAGDPVAAVASVALPKGFDRPQAEAIYLGLRGMGDEFDCPIVGGDVGMWGGALAISVTILARSGGVGPVLRSGATPGEAICVTGSLGGAWRSRRHLEFIPRIRAGRELASRYRLGAMIDISDGLSTDLAHICKASGVGAQIHAEDVPTNSDAAQDSAGRLAAALGDGEDYELLFTLPCDEAEFLGQDQPLDVRVWRIGTVVAGSEMLLVAADGTEEKLTPRGWEHKT